MRQFTILAVLFACIMCGCIEFQTLLGQNYDPIEPEPTFVPPSENDNANDNADNSNDNDADNDNEAPDDNANDNTDDNANDNDSDEPVDDTQKQIDAVNAGEVGAIPAINPVPEQIETETGLIYFDMVQGFGEYPMPDSTVTVKYTGWLFDTGQEFDSNESIQFQLTGLIQGWQEGIVTMQKGGQRRMIIPPDLAYGAGGSGSIPPNATLVFDIELIDFQ